MEFCCGSTFLSFRRKLIRMIIDTSLFSIERKVSLCITYLIVHSKINYQRPGNLTNGDGLKFLEGLSQEFLAI